MYWRFWLANLGTTALFIAIHWPGWLVQPLPYPTMLLNSLSIGVFSIFLGYLAHVTRSLRLSISAHVLNNLLIALGLL